LGWSNAGILGRDLRSFTWVNSGLGSSSTFSTNQINRMSERQEKWIRSMCMWVASYNTHIFKNFIICFLQ
jgi:hypothetical protein